MFSVIYEIRLKKQLSICHQAQSVLKVTYRREDLSIVIDCNFIMCVKKHIPFLKTILEFSI